MDQLTTSTVDPYPVGLFILAAVVLLGMFLHEWRARRRIARRRNPRVTRFCNL